MAEEQRRDGVIEFPHARLTAGGRLRAAREAAGLTLADMAGQTKIPIRMLTLIEAGDYAALPAKAYATGFSRTYARALGLDEGEILAEVRREMGHADPAESRLTPTFEPGDPARVPTARFAWLAAVAALAVLVAGMVLWRSYYAPAVTLPSLLPDPSPAAQQPASVVVPLPAPSLQVPAALGTLPAAAATAAPSAVAAPLAAVPQAAPRIAPKPRASPPATATTPPPTPSVAPGASAGAAAAGAAVAATPSAGGASAPTSTTP